MVGEYGGWGVRSVVAMLCMVICLIFLPLAMELGPVQPPPLYVILIFPVLMAAILIYLSRATKS